MSRTARRSTDNCPYRPTYALLVEHFGKIPKINRPKMKWASTYLQAVPIVHMQSLKFGPFLDTRKTLIKNRISRFFRKK